MNKLFAIPVNGPAEEIHPDLYKDHMEYGAPSLTWLRRGLHCSTIEHVTTLLDGKVVHLFFDENGLYTSQPPNNRASAILGNKRLRGMRAEKLRYNDLSKDPPIAAVTLLLTNEILVGPCYLWTGEVE